MSKLTRGIPDRVVKTLFALSGNRCAFPNCGQSLVEPSTGEESQNVIGEIAHIVAHSEGGPRSDKAVSEDKLNSHENLLLLCPTCHARVDKNPLQYTVNVLRSMKKGHESKFAAVSDTGSGSETVITDEVFTTVLPISRLPQHVYSADTEFRKQNAVDIWEHIEHDDASRLSPSFELKSGRLFSFHNLAQENGPFRGACTPKTTRKQRDREMWLDPNDRRTYTALLNRALRSHLYRKGIRFHPKYQRFYFILGKNRTERVESYKSLSGRRQARNVVWNPITKATGRGKRHWIHLAAGLHIHYLGSDKWILTIRPERYLTKDGYIEFDSKNVGRKVTRLKATMHNRAYLSEVRFWASFICNHSARLTLQLGSQWLTIENRLLETKVEWIGIPGDDQSFTERQPEEDLFSYAELSRIDDQLDGLDDYEEEEEL